MSEGVDLSDEDVRAMKLQLQLGQTFSRVNTQNMEHTSCRQRRRRRRRRIGGGGGQEEEEDPCFSDDCVLLELLVRSCDETRTRPRNQLFLSIWRRSVSVYLTADSIMFMCMVFAI